MTTAQEIFRGWTLVHLVLPQIIDEAWGVRVKSVRHSLEIRFIEDVMVFAAPEEHQNTLIRLYNEFAHELMDELQHRGLFDVGKWVGLPSGKDTELAAKHDIERALRILESKSGISAKSRLKAKLGIV